MIEDIFQVDNYVLSKKLLDVTDVRHELLAGNLANIETPGYKRMDIAPSFEKHLLNSVYSDDFEGVRKAQIDIEKDTKTKSLREDGNNVELDKELMKMNQNAMEYEFLSLYVSNNIKALNKAIVGRIK